jgi:hypothetical protein
MEVGTNVLLRNDHHYSTLGTRSHDHPKIRKEEERNLHKSLTLA